MQAANVQRRVSPPSTAPIQATKPEPICSICLDPLNHDYLTIGNTSPCGHCFHELCFQQHQVSRWLSSRLRSTVPCPECQQTVETYSRLYMTSGYDAMNNDDQPTNGALDMDDTISRHLWVGSADAVSKSLRQLHLAMREKRSGILMSPFKEFTLSLIRKGAVVALVRTFQRHSYSAAVAETVLRCLILLSERNGPICFKVLLETQSGVATIVTMLERFPQDADAQFAGLALMGRLLPNVSNDCFLWQELLPKTLHLACRAMMTYTDDLYIHRAASSVIGSTSSVDRGMALLGLNPCWIRPVILSLTKFVADQAVAHNLVLTIEAMVEAYEPIRKALLVSGALAPVVAVGNHHVHLRESAQQAMIGLTGESDEGTFMEVG